MVEAVSFAGVAELPLVMFMSQRPGPATGMPTWTEQGDLLFTVNAGHGEFPKIVLAPGDVHEMVDLTLKAFDYADIYQTPVIVMSDKLLSESHQSWNKEEIMRLPQEHPEDRGKTVQQTQQSPYLRYRLSDDGISERLLPGQKGHFYQSNSYEHAQDSHTSESGEDRIQQVQKRAQKQETYLKTHFAGPAVLGDMNAAEVVFVSWGGNKNLIREAQNLLEAQGTATAFVHFTHIYPMDPEKVRAAFPEGKRYILIENNATAQFGKLLRAETGIHLEERLLRYDGRPHMPEDIAAYVTSSLKNT
jgi:2-oxoglutarate ferredoxin oxidoreductase subunit alpha